MQNHWVSIVCPDMSFPKFRIITVQEKLLLNININFELVREPINVTLTVY